MIWRWLRRTAGAPLLHFLVLGVLLYLLCGERPVGSPPMAAPLSGDQHLLAMARARGWHRDDPVVQRRLIHNMRFLFPQRAATDAALLAEAYHLDMDRSDPVVQRRLLSRMQLALAATAQQREPSLQALRTFFRQHRAQFSQPARATVHHVFLSRDRHGAHLPAQAATLAAMLQRRALSPAAALRYSDPFPWPMQLSHWTAAQFRARLGAPFATAALHTAPVQQWSAPLESSYGFHMLWVVSRTPAVAANFSAQRARVRRAFLAARAQQALLSLSPSPSQ